jgi:hypothetical protein
MNIEFKTQKYITVGQRLAFDNTDIEFINTQYSQRRAFALQ